MIVDADDRKNICKDTKYHILKVKESLLSSDNLMNLVPVKPMLEDEVLIKDIYKKKLDSIFQKFKSL